LGEARRASFRPCLNADISCPIPPGGWIQGREGAGGCLVTCRLRLGDVSRDGCGSRGVSVGSQRPLGLAWRCNFGPSTPVAVSLLSRGRVGRRFEGLVCRPPRFPPYCPGVRGKIPRRPRRPRLVQTSVAAHVQQFRRIRDRRAGQMPLRPSGRSRAESRAKDRDRWWNWNCESGMGEVL